MKGSSTHGNGYVKATCTDGNHADSASSGSVGVGAKKGLARLAEALQVHLMTDSVTAAGEPQAVLGCNALKIAVVVHVAEVGLEGVVVDVGDGKLRANTGNADGLEL